MVMRGKNRLLETPGGVGTVWEGNIEIAKVNYQLKVQQEVSVISTSGKTEEIEGLKSMTGSISVLKSTKQLWGTDKLILHLKDGRKIDFYIKAGGPGSGNFHIQPSGDFY
jgi:hypothetical protein